MMKAPYGIILIAGARRRSRSALVAVSEGTALGGRQLSLTRRIFISLGQQQLLDGTSQHVLKVTGDFQIIVGGRERRLKPKGAVTVPKGAWHRIENPGKAPVVIIEVQHGPYLGEDDIIRRRDDYGRVADAKGGSAPRSTMLAGAGRVRETRRSRTGK